MEIKTKLATNQKAWCLKQKDEIEWCENCKTAHTKKSAWYVSGESSDSGYCGRAFGAWYVDDIKIEVTRSYHNEYDIDIKYHLSNDEGWECQEDIWEIREKDVFGTMDEAVAECEKRNLELNNKN